MAGKPKPVEGIKDTVWTDLIPGILNDASGLTNDQVLANLKAAATVMQRQSGIDFWISDAGQAELLRRIRSERKPPTATRPWGSSTSTTAATLSVFDYTEASKAMIDKGALSAVNGGDEWIEHELTADSGACDTVIPRGIAESIPIMPSLASMRGMEYKVANGASVQTWASGAASFGLKGRRRPRG